MSLPKVHSPADLAEVLGKSEYWVEEQVRTGRFPHRRVGRSVRFTDEDVTKILDLLSVDAPSVPSQPTGPAIGMTARGRARRERARRSA